MGRGMMGLGMMLIWGGVLGLVTNLNVDTTVATPWESSQQVHNIGLMDQRRNRLMVSALAVVCGTLFFGFGVLADPQDERGNGKEVHPSDDEKYIRPN